MNVVFGREDISRSQAQHGNVTGNEAPTLWEALPIARNENFDGELCRNGYEVINGNHPKFLKSSIKEQDGHEIYFATIQKYRN